jgi:tRNA(Arg) A34 adenosine deaminase TadA
MTTSIFSAMYGRALMIDKVANARVVGCLYSDGKLYWGKNSKKSHPFQKRFGKHEDAIYLHAEIDVIKNFIEDNSHGVSRGSITDLSNCTLYVLRIKQEGRDGPIIPALAKPCSGCMGAVARFGIKNVYYSTNNSREWECL